MLTKDILTDLKSFEWNEVIKKGKGLDDLNTREWRFIKGLIAELILEKHSQGQLKRVGQIHKDFDWSKHNLSVELKSQFSKKMYDKKGRICKNFDVKLNNSNGTNKEILPQENVSDLLIVIRNNGAFVIDKQTVIDKAKYQGDGFSVILSESDIVEITGKIEVDPDNSNMQEMILNGIRERI